MERERFQQLVAEAVESLPEEFMDRLENVDVVVEDYPPGHRRPRHGETLLGLYEGVPLTDRTANYGMVPPDKITIFQKPIEAIFKDESKIIEEIQKVVQHEIAHHFGISDARLDELESEI